MPIDGRDVVHWWGRSHIVGAGGNPQTGGCELIGDAELAAYVQTWALFAYRGAGAWVGGSGLRVFPGCKDAYTC